MKKEERLIRSWAKIETFIDLEVEIGILNIKGINVPDKIYNTAKRRVVGEHGVRLSVGKWSRKTGVRYVYLRDLATGVLICRAKTV